LALFAARDPIPYLPPVDKLTWEKKTDGYSGVAHLLTRFECSEDTPAPVKVETRDEKLERKKKEKLEQVQYKLEQEIALWNPQTNEKATGDPYKTLFVARINYDTSESKLRREFEIYGPIKKIRMVHDKENNKPRGYAFIEYEHERDMHNAYKNGDGRKIDGRRVLVDVERARTVKGWLPRSLGGGLGGTRRGGPDVNIKHSGREDDRKRSVDRDRDHRRERMLAESRDRSERRRSRTRDRDSRRKRSRSRDRKRRRSREREEGDETRSRRRRSRSRERKHRRSRSPREKKHRRDRDKERKPNLDGLPGDVKIKAEPVDDYPVYGDGGYDNMPLKDEDRPRNGAKPEKDEREKAQQE